ncbi:MAG: ThiF family adenylyltransferase [Trebonia sp.]
MKPRTGLSAGQQEALAALTSIVRSSGGDILIEHGSDRVVGSWLELRVWLSSARIPVSPDGIPLVEREPIDILIPHDYPFRHPEADAGHTRFAGQPHVMWGKQLCLYASRGEWDPAAGMAGFLRRLLVFYQELAAGTLGGPGAPWHPPVVYTDAEAGCLVIRADLAADDLTRDGTRRRWAIGVQKDQDRTDIVGWLAPGADDDTEEGSVDKLAWRLVVAAAAAGFPDVFLVPAVVLPQPIAFEYPEAIGDLLDAFEDANVRFDDIAKQIALGIRANKLLNTAHELKASKSTYLLIRAPADKRFSVSEGPAHFAAWRLVAEDEALISGEADPGQALERLAAWVYGARLSWAHIYDTRPEATIRRDTGRPVGKVRGRRVLILGCGALGAPIAEHCARAGATELTLIDNGTVNPGILVRQPYYDADIGLPKAEALACRLRGIHPGLRIFGVDADVHSFGRRLQRLVEGFDLVIDATADRSVAARIERMRLDKPRHWPDLAAVGISQSARYGIAAVVPRGSTGAGVDAYRRLALAALEDAALADAYREFFPSPGERIEIEPERGCSAPTFIGSATDVSALAAQLLESVLASLERDKIRVSSSGEAVRERCDHRTLCVARLGSDDGTTIARTHLVLPHDRIVADHSGMYEVRIDHRVMERIREIACDAAVASHCLPTVETGGLLLGQFDDACRIAWVSEVTGPPEGSLASSHRMVINTAAAREHARERSSKTGGLVSFLGLWHTHTEGPASPSAVDLDAMERLIAEAPGYSPRFLFLVLRPPGNAGSPSAGCGPEDWDPGIYAEVFLRDW